MHTIKLSHDEMVVLEAIADQDVWTDNICLDGLDAPLQSLVDRRMVLVKHHPMIGSFCAIAPEILSLNHPPYSYESWRALSE